METNNMTYTSFPMISNMLQKVQEEFSNGVYESMDECLNQHIRKNKYWPMIQMKRFNTGNNNGLVLLHNTYKRDDVEHFKDLYEEIRSVVLDLNAPAGKNIVVSLADKIPIRMNDTVYRETMSETDQFERGYEGTMIYVYYHMDRWFFGTSTCPSVDRSRYFHPTKTHGTMLNEVLMRLFPDDVVELVAEAEDGLSPKELGKKLRTRFTSLLNPAYTYGFMLVHHENRHFMDYTSVFGANYKELFHIFTRETITSNRVDAKLTELPLIQYIETFPDGNTALETLLSDPQMYALMVRKQNGDMVKVSRQELIQRESEDLGNANPWMNMLWVYMQNKPNYQVENYVDQYLSEKKETLNVVDSEGRVLVPIYIIHTVMCTMRDVIYYLYYSTTYYNKHTQQYTMNKEYDQQLPAILRFHLAQLRHIQITSHKHSPLTPRAIYHYLCLHQTLKNIRLLINFFKNNPYNMQSRSAECMKILADLLHK
jgi:hypothetical protein